MIRITHLLTALKSTGVQREIRPGLVVNVDYVMNRGVHFGMLVDRNRSARPTASTFLRRSKLAMNIALQIMVRAGNERGECGLRYCCRRRHFPNSPMTEWARVRGSMAFHSAATIVVSANMSVIEPVGLSRYQGLQVLLSGKLGTWGQFKNASTNFTYALSTFKTTSLDQDFLDKAVTNSDPTAFYGPSNLDRRHQLGVSLITELPFGIRFSTITQYKTNEPSSMFLDLTGNSAADIFVNDFNGDGSVLNHRIGRRPDPGYPAWRF